MKLNCFECGLCCFFGKQGAGKKYYGIEIGEDGWCIHYRDNRCSVYETRPQTCKDFIIGSEICLRTRKRNICNKKIN